MATGKQILSAAHFAEESMDVCYKLEKALVMDKEYTKLEYVGLMKELNLPATKEQIDGLLTF